MTTNFKTAADFRKSLESRLQKAAMTKGENLQRLRRKVAFDRLLARIFSMKQPTFFLKGGYAIELRLQTARATVDIDLTSLKRIQGEQDLLSALILEELRDLAQKDLGDFFTYHIGDAQVDLDNAPYGGARYPASYPFWQKCASIREGILLEQASLALNIDSLRSGLRRC